MANEHRGTPVGWLEPLLSPIAKDPRTVVCPVIDVLSDDTFEYHYRDSSGVNVGGFDWNLQVWLSSALSCTPRATGLSPAWFCTVGKVAVLDSWGASLREGFDSWGASKFGLGKVSILLS